MPRIGRIVFGLCLLAGFSWAAEKPVGTATDSMPTGSLPSEIEPVSAILDTSPPVADDDVKHIAAAGNAPDELANQPEDVVSRIFAYLDLH